MVIEAPLKLKVKRILIISVGIVILYAAYIAVSLISLPSVADLTNRRYSMTIQVKDWKGKYHPFTVGPKNRYWSPSESIPPEMKWAVILAEDSRFYKHEGIDVKAIKNAIKYDLEKKSFARGASTLTQQVAKNLFLTREKSITRKIKEIILAKRMEEVLTKGRIIELYLNVVELGPMTYGIGHGAHYYFGKPASELTPRECAFLAAMLPGPRMAYNPYKNLGKVLKRSDMILRLLRQKGVLGEAEYQAALAQSPNIGRMQQKIDEVISTPPTFTSPSSARKDPAEPLAEPAAEQKEKPVDPPVPQSGDTAPANQNESPADKK